MKSALRVIFLSAIAPLSVAIIAIVAVIYSAWFVEGPKGLNELEAGADSGAGHYAMFIVFGVQTLIYCTSAVFLRKMGIIIGLVGATLLFIAWSALTGITDSSGSVAGGIASSCIIAPFFSFGAALLAEYTIHLMTRIRLASSSDPDVEALSYWRNLFARMDRAGKR
jgi:hypothetical protein